MAWWLLFLFAEDPYRLAEAGRFAEAWPGFVALAAKAPADANLRYTAGLVAWQAGRWGDAREQWLAAKRLRPERGAVRAQLVKAHQTLGDRAARDLERAELVEMWRSRKDPEFSRVDTYTRDEFTAGGHRVVVHERLKPGAERLIFSSGQDRIVLICPARCFLEGQQRYAEYPVEPAYDDVRARVMKLFAEKPGGSPSAAGSPKGTP